MKDMKGTLYAIDFDKRTAALLQNLEAHGHRLLANSTQLEYKAPYVITGRIELIGDRAIRDFFKLNDTSDLRMKSY
jgi:hypothetical protein